MYRKIALFSISSFAAVYGQQIGTNMAEVHPALPWELCTTSGGCVSQAGKVVLDANWRWVHNTGGSTNCYTGNQWDATLCPDPTTCATNCALDGANYSGTYGVTTSGNALTLKFVTGSNVGSRLYLMNTADTEYELFKPLNQEFTFDVDVSALPCGLNGALYFSQMDADGGMAKYPANKAGAKYGTGYCDSQCPRDIKFIDGQANMLDWNATSANSGTGSIGTCCSEMDLWEANSISAAYTPHPCTPSAQTKCTAGTNCTTLCDQAGCDFNSYRMGDLTFYGPGMTIDTTQKFTVVTQFITSDNTTTGTLTEIRRFYVQNGVTFANSNTNLPGLATFNSITEPFCKAQKALVGDTDSFDAQGGLAEIGKGFQQGTVLVLSIWDDYAVNMLWLDSSYPPTANPSAPGVTRGTCSPTSGAHATVEADSPNAQVIYSNIKFGDIGSTFGAGTSTGTTTAGSTPTTTAGSTPTTTKATTTTTASGATQTHYGQCAGTGYTGPTTCASPYTCTYSNPYYSQCL